MGKTTGAPDLALDTQLADHLTKLEKDAVGVLAGITDVRCILQQLRDTPAAIPLAEFRALRSTHSAEERIVDFVATGSRVWRAKELTEYLESETDICSQLTNPAMTVYQALSRGVRRQRIARVGTGRYAPLHLEMPS